MRKRQEKNIYIQPPRNILLQFFFFSHQSQDIKRIFKYLLVTVAYEKSWFRVLEVLWTGEKGFSQVEETFSSFFFRFWLPDLTLIFTKMATFLTSHHRR